MTSTSPNQAVSGSGADEQPLLRALVAEASRNGHTLAHLAAELGVTYERLAQWRRGEGSIASARRSVHERAAKYLSIPTVLVLVLAGQIGLSELVWPGRGSLKDRITRELQRIRENVGIGAFVPADLSSASDAVKMFVIFLCHELEEDGRQSHRTRWLAALQQASVQARSTEASSGRSPPEGGSFF